MKLYVYGYFCCNLGDDLFLKILFSKYPHYQFYIPAGKEYKNIFESKKYNLNIIPDNFFVKILNKILRLAFNGFDLMDLFARYCDASILITGSIFQQKNTEIKAKKYFDWLPSNKNPLFIMGTNFGPYKTKEFEKEARNYFKNCKWISFRDQKSANIFKDLSNVNYAPDIVLGLNEYINKDTSEFREGNKTIVISVLNFKQKSEISNYSEAYQDFLINITSTFIKSGYKVKFMSFCKVEGDEIAIEEILTKFSLEQKKHISTYFYSGNIDESLQILRDASGYVATRFHCMILGWIFRKPVLPIIYNPKMHVVIDEYGFNGSFVTLDNLSTFDTSNISWMNAPLFEVKDLESDSKKHFIGLDEFFIKNSLK